MVVGVVVGDGGLVVRRVTRRLGGLAPRAKISHR